MSVKKQKNTEAEKNNLDEIKNRQYKKVNRNKKIMLWTGVGIFATSVFAMWLLSAMSFLGDANRDKEKSTEFKLWKNSLNDLNNIFQTTKQDINKINEGKEKMEELESKINLLIDNINEISSTTTSTIKTQTTSTSTTSTTKEIN
jgi:DNA-binding protein H-NS